MKKRMLALSLALLSSITFSQTFNSVASAATQSNPIAVLVNYNKVTFPSNQNPYIKEGVTMVPVRGVFEQMSANVSWERNASGKIVVTAKHFEDTVKLTVGSKTAQRNGVNVQLDKSVENVNGRITVPLRFLSESFGAQVKWVPRSKSGNSFDHILINGQFNYPDKVVNEEMTYSSGGYGTPVTVKSFPIIIEHPDKTIKINNITSSLYIWNKPGTSQLFGRATANNDPDFNSLKMLSKGIVRLDVEITAKNDGVKIDETTMGKNMFFVSSKMKNGQLIETAAPYQLKGTPLTPDLFDGFLATKTLKKGEKLKGTLPMEISSPTTKQDFIVNINTHDTLSYSLKIPSTIAEAK
ncbi:copper amine oxidase N-terminal domain-containing protein [Paenibacillus sp. 1A_MP2]|uniref:copper amine oxidase N-terminal domain-containing protein n=1 Tax=Paenibacillus sp. 1A_MP2 TaxID=3457495 RepID=UPI003FCC46CE